MAEKLETRSELFTSVTETITPTSMNFGIAYGKISGNISDMGMVIKIKINNSGGVCVAIGMNGIYMCTNTNTNNWMIITNYK